MQTFHVPPNSGERYPKPKYRTDSNPAYRGNLLVEAIPDVPDHDSAYAALAYQPPQRGANFRSDPPHRKLDLVLELDRVFVPTEQHIQALQLIVAVVRECYSYRNPNDPKVQNALYVGLKMGSIGLSRLSPTGGGSIGLVLWGVTGVGKTSFVDRLCDYLGTQPIFHQEIQGRPCLWPQLPIVRIQCKNSLKGTIAALISEIDSKLHTTHGSGLGGKINRDMHVTKVANVLKLHFVGLLIVEDVQKLKDSEHDVLEYFCDLMEEGGFPVLLVANYKFRGTLTSDGSLLSKLTGKALIDFEPISFVEHGEVVEASGESNFTSVDDSDEWTPMVEELWNLNVFSKPRPMPRDLPRWLHFHTEGIRRIARQMMAAIFVRALHHGSEDGEELEVTENLLDDIASKELLKYQPAIEHLRKRKRGDPITDAEALLFESYFLPESDRHELRKGIERRNAEARRQGGPKKAAAKTAAEKPPTDKQASPPRKRAPRKIAATHNKPAPQTESAADVYARLVKEGKVFRHDRR